MLYSIDNRDDLEKIDKLVSLQNQVKELRLQDKFGKQNFHENIYKVFERVTETIKITSEDLTKIMMLTTKENNKTPEKLNDKLLEILNDRGVVASYLLSPLSIITNTDHSGQYKLVKI